MLLRTRILLGYGYLVTLLVLSASGAALAFHQLGRNIDRLLTENVASVRSAMGMLEALERQDSAVLSLLLDREGARDTLARSQAEFHRYLDQAASNVTDPREPDVIASIRHQYAAYVRVRDGLLSGRPERPLVAYEEATFPAFTQVKSTVLDLLEVNHDAMETADASARRFAVRASLALGLVVAAALLSLGLLSRNLQKELLERLAEMKHAAEAIAHGESRRRVRAVRDDELGMVARQLNAALDAQEELERRVAGRYNHQKQLLLGLMNSWQEPVALVGLDGILVASTLAAEETALVEVSQEALRKKGQENLSRADNVGELSFELSIGEVRVTAEALAVGGTRPVGWLVTVRQE